MTYCDDFIAKIKRDLPELCTTKDLIRIGLFTSEQAAHAARKKGFAPEYFKLPQGSVRFPKQGVIYLLEKSKHSHKAC
jgi:hypothetical protein